MPSPSHEALVMLFRSRPALAVELLRDALGIELPAHTRAILASETLRQINPVELHADAVVLLEAERAVLAVIVEVQLGRDDEKALSWPCYLALLRRDLDCPCLLLVVALDDAVAKWSARPIALGHPGLVLRPLVVGRSVVPRIVDRARALADVELAVLSAVAHGAEEDAPEDAVAVAVAAVHAIAGGDALDDDRRRVYLDLVLGALGGAAKTALEALMKQGGYEYQSDFAKRYVAQGRAEGEVRGEAEALLTILQARGLEVGAARSEAIRACTDLARLDAWLRRAAVATRVSEVFDDEG